MSSLAQTARAAGRALAAAAVLLAAGSPAAAVASDEIAGRLAVRATPQAEVRRWEHVLLVRTASEIADALSRAERAALEEGGAVLDVVRTSANPSWAEHRFLVRTRERGAIVSVVREIRRQRGVMGVSVVRLPETPTYPGGPSFLSSYLADSGGEENAGRIVPRHEVPPVLDKRDLVESTPVPVGPSMEEDAQLGGFTLNVSEMLARLRLASWVRREERLRATPIVVLPMPGEPADPVTR